MNHPAGPGPTNRASPTLNEAAASSTTPEREDWPRVSEPGPEEIPFNTDNPFHPINYEAGYSDWVQSLDNNQHRVIRSNPRAGKPQVNSSKRRRMDLTASQEIPDTAQRTPGTRREPANTSPAQQGARPKTGRNLPKRPKRGRTE